MGDASTKYFLEIRVEMTVELHSSEIQVETIVEIYLVETQVEMIVVFHSLEIQVEITIGIYFVET